jgi:hypothetical protein
LTLAGVDRYVGFNEFWLVLGEVLSPFPALALVPAILSRYRRALNRQITKRDKALMIFLSLVFIFYYVALPWDWGKIAGLIGNGGF